MLHTASNGDVFLPSGTPPSSCPRPRTCVASAYVDTSTRKGKPQPPTPHQRVDAALASKGRRQCSNIGLRGLKERPFNQTVWACPGTQVAYKQQPTTEERQEKRTARTHILVQCLSHMRRWLSRLTRVFHRGITPKTLMPQAVEEETAVGQPRPKQQVSALDD